MQTNNNVVMDFFVGNLKSEHFLLKLFLNAQFQM